MIEKHPTQNGDPDEAEHEELLQFASELKAALPQLAPEAMNNVADVLRREMAARKVMNWRPRLLAAAAIILITFATAFVTASVLGKADSEPSTAFAIHKESEAPRDLERQRILLEQFESTINLQAKLALLPEMAKHCDDAKLSPEARYLLALETLRPHLEWHELYEPSVDQVTVLDHKSFRQKGRERDSTWSEAHKGLDWMISESSRQKARGEAKRRWERRNPLLKHLEEAESGLYWRVADMQHPDVTRSLALLGGVQSDPWKALAQVWVREIARNNTVLTFDVKGSYQKNEVAPVVIDTRSTDTISLKLYRVRKPEQFMAVSERVGEDFIFRDYGLPGEMMKEMLQHAVDVIPKLSEKRRQFRNPSFEPHDLVSAWDTNVSDMKALQRTPHEWFDDEDVDGEALYFGDACSAYRDRLEKTYFEDSARSAWLCNRILNIPASVLNQEGAYVLVAEANGQKAYAPILVNPLSLTLGRCRDGVFALVSDADGKQGIANAKILARDMLGDTVADQSGAAFARVFAAGDKPIVAWNGERFAIGGFGRLFEGIYKRETDRFLFKRMALAKAVDVVASSNVAQMYADRQVVAAYTDRPTYRPGQEVQFKLIVRQMKAADQTTKVDGPVVVKEFRAEDFELTTKLELPAAGLPLKYDVINSRGRSVLDGKLELNDFGTAAGKFVLSSEDATGLYSLRVLIGEMSYIVPDVFAVKYYRRSNIEVDVVGVPELIKPRQVLKLQALARYYFGKPVHNGRIDARLVRKSDHQLIVESSAQFTGGAAELELSVPDLLGSSSYLVVATVTDESGRAVSKTLPCKTENAVKDVPPVSELPRFIAAGASFKVSVDSELVARRMENEDAKKFSEQRFKSDNGIATFVLKNSGWYTISTKSEATEIFVYGGEVSPFRNEIQESRDGLNAPRWVNLGNYELEEDQGYDYPSAGDLYALFDRQAVRSGDKLRVLIYAPFHRARLLFTIEGRTVSDYFITSSDAASYYRVIEIPIKARHAPNFYLQGRILAGDSEGHPNTIKELRKQALQEEALEEVADGEDPRWCRIDVIDNALAGESDSLKISVTPDRTEYLPGGNVNVAIQVFDLQGRPKEAEVSLSAIDESIYEFGEDRSGQVSQMFEHRRAAERYYRKTWRSGIGNTAAALRVVDRQLAMDAAQQALESLKDMAKASEATQALRQLSTPVAPLASLGQMPAGAVSSGYLRTDFRETAVWQPQLRSGADGKIITSFTLPDSLTSWRLNALGVTRNTEFGRALAKFRTRQPLAVQLFLPRFAIEKDRLQLTALIHNDGDIARTCQALWKISGATVESWAEPILGTSTSVDNETRCTASIVVPAHGTGRAVVWARMGAPGTMKVQFGATEGGDTDGEERVIPIYTLGRAREVSLQGVFENETSVNLPAGFVAETLRISLTRGNAARGLSNIGGLVDYPYGCVEQTMSRFLPAVMVAHATRNAPVVLPTEIQKKLPDVLAKGLTRLYNFQHSDGGWGWWENDATSNQMTVYVVYGLARCASTGTNIDSNCMTRATDYLLKVLRSGELVRNPGPFLHGDSSNTVAELESAAWLALALAGKAPTEELKRIAEQCLVRGDGPGARANLALACKSVGLTELGDKLHQTTLGWNPKSILESALKLRTETTFGAPQATCELLAEALLTHSSGRGSTRETSASIEALAELLAQIQMAEPAQAYQVEARGREIFSVKEGPALKKMFQSVKVDTEMIRGEELPLKLTAKCAEKVHYNILASGTQRLDKIQPLGTDVRLLRTYSKLDGTPVNAPVNAGEFIAVKLLLTLAQAQSYLIVEDRIPAGWEFADDQLSGDAAKGAANVEFRDDRVCAFFTQLGAGSYEMTYYLRAETRGTVSILPGCAYPMYSERVRGETGSASLQVK